jgi:DMSO/TMAO reductase YedYZ molybdopterin-dependent catalytic subunit
MPHLLRLHLNHGSTSAARPAALRRRVVLAGAFQALTLLAACSALPPKPPAGPETAPAASATLAAPPAPVGLDRPCAVSPVVRPTTVPYPGYTEMEPSTGLHVTGPAQEVDPLTYRLKVIGLVEQTLSLSYDEIRCLPKTQAHTSLTCPGFFTDEANLAGFTFADLFALARPQAKATRVKLTSVEGYDMRFSLDEVLAPGSFLAYQWKEEPLPPSHGFPLRAVFPLKSGANWVKWVTQIELS